jgi:lysozyme family protein
MENKKNKLNRHIAILDDIEGNYTKDQGGHTYKGITLGTYNSWRKQKKKPPVSVEQLKQLPYGEIQDFYKEVYYDAHKLNRVSDEVDDDLAGLILQYDINADYGTAIKDFQRAVKIPEKYVDGIIGDQTIKAAIAERDKRGSQAIMNDIVKYQANHYKNIIEKDPARHQGSANGWFNRRLPLAEAYYISKTKKPKQIEGFYEPEY